MTFATDVTRRRRRVRGSEESHTPLKGRSATRLVTGRSPSSALMLRRIAPGASTRTRPHPRPLGEAASISRSRSSRPRATRTATGSRTAPSGARRPTRATPTPTATASRTATRTPARVERVRRSHRRCSTITLFDGGDALRQGDRGHAASRASAATTTPATTMGHGDDDGDDDADDSDHRARPRRLGRQRRRRRPPRTAAATAGTCAPDALAVGANVKAAELKLTSDGPRVGESSSSASPADPQPHAARTSGAPHGAPSSSRASRMPAARAADVRGTDCQRSGTDISSEECDVPDRPRGRAARARVADRPGARRARPRRRRSRTSTARARRAR